MPFQISQFDDLNLPVLNPSQQHDTQPGASALVDSIGGFFNRFGSDDARAQRQPITINGLVWGEDTFMDDGEGGSDSTETYADAWLIGDGETMLRSQLQALRDKVRKQGTLWRVNFDNDARQWKTAYFTRMGQPQVVDDRVFKAAVALEFEPLMTNWHAEEAVTFSVNTTAGVTATMSVENGGGATAHDAVLTITRTSGTITNIAIGSVDLGIGLSWIGSLGAGNVLVIDGGAKTVLKDGAASYTQFTVAGTVPGWLPIQPGSYEINIITTGGAATCELTFFEQFA